MPFNGNEREKQAWLDSVADELTKGFGADADPKTGRMVKKLLGIGEDYYWPCRPTLPMRRWNVSGPRYGR